MTGTYAIIGDPIDHSLSPVIHNAAFRELGLDCAYIAYRVPADELAESVGSMRGAGIAGFNVTMPHKVATMRHLDVVDENCSVIGACNTVANSDGMLRGYNTDFEGFLDPLRRRKTSIGGMDVLLLGAGGAARAIVAALAREGARNVTVANRTLASASDLADFAESGGLQARYVGLDKAGSLSAYDMIVNSTSLGMGGESPPLDFGTLSEDTTVYDIVYRPINTGLIKEAKARGAEVVYGYEMMLGQAAESFSIWHGVKAPYDTMKRAMLGGA